MPNTISATKALRQTKRRYIINTRIRRAYKAAVKLMRTQPSDQNLQQAFATLDKAAKKNVISPGKANRLKSRLSKLTAKKS